VPEPDPLREQEYRDIFESLYRGNPRTGTISITVTKLPGKMRGLHTFTASGEHQIKIDVHKIMGDFATGEAIGGNSPAPTLRMAVGLVLAHETQHANQILLHNGHEKFFNSRRYRTRGCEAEAREFADNNSGVVAQVLSEHVNHEIKSDDQSSDCVEDFFRAVEDAQDMSIDEVIEVLRGLGKNNPIDLDRVMSDSRMTKGSPRHT